MQCPSHTMREPIIHHTNQHTATHSSSTIAKDDSPTTHNLLPTSQEKLMSKNKNPKIILTFYSSNSQPEATMLVIHGNSETVKSYPKLETINHVNSSFHFDSYRISNQINRVDDAQITNICAIKHSHQRSVDRFRCMSRVT